MTPEEFEPISKAIFQAINTKQKEIEGQHKCHLCEAVPEIEWLCFKTVAHPLVTEWKVSDGINTDEPEGFRLDTKGWALIRLREGANPHINSRMLWLCPSCYATSGLQESGDKDAV